MAVAGLMLAGAMKLLGGQLDQSRLKATRDRLQMAYDALVTHYVTHAPSALPGRRRAGQPGCRLWPGPAGDRRPAAPAVAAINQVLPWRTLGLQEELSFDGWRQRLSYHVSAPLTTTGAAGPGDLSIRNGAASAPGTTELTGAAAFVVREPGRERSRRLAAERPAQDHRGHPDPRGRERRRQRAVRRPGVRARRAGMSSTTW